MDLVRKLFPITAKEKDITSLIIAIVIYIVIGVIGGLVLGLLGAIPVLGIIAWPVGIVLDIYGLAGIILSVLDFLGVKLSF